VKHLEAVKAIGPDQAERVMAKVKETPTDDPLFGKGFIRADGVRCTYVLV
jgi:branched-chain amino acid transport system substrate-binding protein